MEPSCLPVRDVLSKQGHRGLSKLCVLHAAHNPQHRNRSPAVVWVLHSSQGYVFRGMGRVGTSEALREEGQVGSGDVS